MTSGFCFLSWYIRSIRIYSIRSSLGNCRTFWNLQGRQYNFSENFRCNLMLYDSKVRNFLISRFRYISESKTFEASFLTNNVKNSASEIPKAHLLEKICNRPQALENSRQYLCFCAQIFFKKIMLKYSPLV